MVMATGAIGGFTIANQLSNSQEDTRQSSERRITDLTSQPAVQMDIRGFAYGQPNIKVKKGTTVTWTNQDTTKHNAMASHSEDEHAHDAPAKSEVRADLFAGPMLSKGESYSFTFGQTGTYPYHCAPHPYMTGSVTVID